jgi:hypothetical protein
MKSERRLAIIRAGELEFCKFWMVEHRDETRLIQETGEHWCAAELHRVTGELLIAQAVGNGGDVSESKRSSRLPPGAATEAESCFRQALAIARKQHARSWEVRASASLNRLHGR